MSIVRQLIQICMVEAIRGRTLAGDAVLDSNIAAIGKLDFKDEQHVVACSVEESDQNEKYGRGFFGRPADLKLYVQIAVAVKAKYTIVTGEGEEQVEEVKEIGATDAAREATLNILDRQWKQALIDPANPWGDRFRQLVPTIGRVMDTRITDPEGGRKYAARVYEISATAIAEPEFGVGMPTDIDAILRAARRPRTRAMRGSRRSGVTCSPNRHPATRPRCCRLRPRCQRRPSARSVST